MSPKRLGQLGDGTAYYAPLGELVYDPAVDKVQCHLCGRWFRALAPSHLWIRHGWTHDDYVEAFGLRLRRPLVSPTVSEVKSIKAKRWFSIDPRMRRNLRKGLRAMLEQNRRARQHAQSRAMPLEQQRSRRAAVAAAKVTQANNRSERRSARLHELGFPDLKGFLQARYVDENKPTQMIAAELGVGQAFLRQQLRRFGLGPRPPAYDANEAWRRRRRDEQQRVADRFGFTSFGDYLRDRFDMRWRIQRIAAEVGHHPAWVKKGCRDLRIRPPRFDARRNSRQAFAIGRTRYQEQLEQQRAKRLARLGFPDLRSYLRVRYLEQGWGIREIKRELHAGSSTVERALRKCGLQRRHHRRSATNRR